MALLTVGDMDADEVSYGIFFLGWKSFRLGAFIELHRGKKDALCISTRLFSIEEGDGVF